MKWNWQSITVRCVTVDFSLLSSCFFAVLWALQCTNWKPLVIVKQVKEDKKVVLHCALKKLSKKMSKAVAISGIPPLVRNRTCSLNRSDIRWSWAAVGARHTTESWQNERGRGMKFSNGRLVLRSVMPNQSGFYDCWHVDWPYKPLTRVQILVNITSRGEFSRLFLAMVCCLSRGCQLQPFSCHILASLCVFTVKVTSSLLLKSLIQLLLHGKIILQGSCQRRPPI